MGFSPLPKKLVVIVLSVLAFVFFIVGLGGLGAANAKCADDPANLPCEAIYRTHWYHLFWSIIIFCIWIFCVVRDQLKYPNARTTLMALLVIGCVYCTLSTEALDDDTRSGSDAATAGFAVLTIIFYVAIAVTGLWPAVIKDAQDMGLPTTNPAANAAPKPPVPGPGIPQSSPAPGNYPASPGYGGGQGAGYGYGGQEFTGVGDMRSPQRAYGGAEGAMDEVPVHAGASGGGPYHTHKHTGSHVSAGARQDESGVQDTSYRQNEDDY